MSQIDKNIAYNLKRIRKAQNLSLDMLSEKTGVSKSMLGQIERGESNPTVATVSKIMEGIKVSFEELIYKKEDHIVPVEKENFAVYKEKEGAYKIQIVFSYSRERSFEVFAVEIEPEKTCPGNVCGDNSWVYAVTSRGDIVITVENQEYQIKEGNSLRFPAGREHAIINRGQEQARLYLILSHAEGMI